jgi:hypothetical protein
MAITWRQTLCQQLNGVLSAVAILLAKLVQQTTFALFGSPSVSLLKAAPVVLLDPVLVAFSSHGFGCHFPVRQRITFTPF